MLYNNYATQLLKYFIEKFAEIYGPEYLTHNVHGLIHLPEDCLHHGPLDNFSAFKFENYLYTLKRILKTCRHPLQQVGNRLKEQELLSSSTDHSQYPELQIELETCLSGYNDHTFSKAVKLELFEIRLNRKDNCVMLNNGSVLFVNHICVHDASNEIFVIGFKSLETVPLYAKPCLSTTLNIVRVGLSIPNLSTS